MRYVSILIFVVAVFGFASSYNMTVRAQVFKSPPAAQGAIMAFGDSLVAGPGLYGKHLFTAQLQKRLADAGYTFDVINAGVSGETTAGGLSRLDFTLSQNPDFLILVLGANDMLRNIPIQETERNLRAILDELKKRNIPVLLCGMKSFRNLNLFGDGFQDMYEDIADDYEEDGYNIVFYPFFLEGVAFDNEKNLSDGMHPNSKGVAEIVKRIFPSVEKMVKRAGIEPVQK